MNIFVTDTSPHACARNLDDSRLPKMLVETAQVMSSALHLRGVPSDMLMYKPTHLGRKVVHWASSEYCNYVWLSTHFWALSDEYSNRMGKPSSSHLTVAKALARMDMCDMVHAHRFFRYRGNISTPTSFANEAANLGMGISYLHIEDTVEAYRAYLSHRWCISAKRPMWGFRKPPAWYAG